MVERQTVTLVKPGDRFAGARLIEKGAIEVNLTRLTIVSGSKECVKEKLNAAKLHKNFRRRGHTTAIISEN
jgi:hypothetical protein